MRGSAGAAIDDEWRLRYGPWAVVAGGSKGLGAAFARELAARGMNLVLGAEAREPLETLAAELRQRHDVEVLTHVADLALPGSAESLVRRAAELEVGLLICNAAHAPVGAFLERDLEDKLRAVAVNCAAPVTLIHHLVSPMVQRGKGGIVVMCSLAGMQGTALVATYAATKAFDMVLAESLWEELRGAGVDVVAACAGATRTEMYESTAPRAVRWQPPVMQPDRVAALALAALGRDPRVVTGRWNALAAMFMGLLPRRTAVALMGRSMARLYPQHAPRR